MIRWLAEREEEGIVHARIGREDTNLVAEWANVLRLFATRDGASSSIERVPGADPRLVAKIESGAVPALLRQLSGELAFHGAAVAVEDRAIAFVGDSGAGKSTLGAAMLRHAGASFLADDVVALDSVGWRALPLERDHWLDARSRAALGSDGDELAARERVEKRPSAPLRDDRLPVALGLIVQLAWNEVDEIVLTKLGPMEALGALLPQTLRFVIDEPAAQRREIEMFAALLDVIPVFRLARPCRIDRLASVAAELAACAKANGHGDREIP